MNATGVDPLVSIVVPLFNEEDNVEPLVAAVRDALPSNSAWELLLVDDGSTDHTASLVSSLAASDHRVRPVRLARNYGQAAAIQAGFDHVRGDVVITMDGDLQNDPRDIPRLLARLDEGFDLVAGYRVRRQDRLFTRVIPSRIANGIIHWLTAVPIRDTGCSLKAYRREVVARLNLYSDLHRFIPVLAAATAGARITEIPVTHHQRRRGKSKYGLERVPRVLADLLTVKMIGSFRERPLAMFALGGLASLTVAAGFGVAALLESGTLGHGGLIVFSAVTLLCLGLAGYLLMLGLIAEVALHRARAAELAPSVSRKAAL